MTKEDKFIQKKLKSVIMPNIIKALDFDTPEIIDDKYHIVRGKFSAFGNIDDDRDRIHKGAFAKSIIELGPESSTNRKIAFVWQHDMRDPIGKHTLLEELDSGAYFNARLSDFDAVPNAKRTWYQLNDGTLNQFSYGLRYNFDKMEYDEVDDAWDIYELSFYEISPVTAGANEQTEFVEFLSDVKSTKSYLSSIKETWPEKFNEIKKAIQDIEGVEEPKDSFILGSIAEKLINS